MIESGELERLGSHENIRVNVRILTTTNCDLKGKVQSGLFRSDLFYRLNAIPISLPPLRDRDDDAVVLAHYFLKRYIKTHGKSVKEFSAEALQLLRSYPWPGNVRELEHTIENAVLLSPDGRITACDLQLRDPNSESPDMTLEEMRLSLIKKCLVRNRGNVSKSARQLGLSRKGLVYVLNKHGIKASAFRPQNT